MYQHFIHLNDKLFLVNYRNRIFKVSQNQDADNKIGFTDEFHEIENDNKTLTSKNYYVLRDRLMCTQIQDRSKYVCLVHDLTDHGRPKEERRRRKLYYILEIWSIDEKSEKPVFTDYKIPIENFKENRSPPNTTPRGYVTT